MTSQIAPVAEVNSTSIERFAEAVAGLAEVVTDSAVLTDTRTRLPGVGAAAELMLRPHNQNEIAAIVRIANDHGALIFKIGVKVRPAVDYAHDPTLPPLATGVRKAFSPNLLRLTRSGHAR